MTPALMRSPKPLVPPLARRDDGSRETDLILTAIALIAIHVLDDNYLQPQPGMSPGDHLASGLVPLSLLGVAAWAYPRLRGTWRGALALLLGSLGLAAGSEAFYYTRAVGPSGDDFTGLLAIPAGLLLIGLGAVTLWRTRRTGGSPAWRYARRALLTFASLFVAVQFIMVVAFNYGTTHLGRAIVPPDRLGVAHEDVAFKTRDGLRLERWYVPSRNGAAVIAFPGRRGPQAQTRMLARHGYGVLLFDRRGEGRSDGEPNAWGWDGDADVKAGIAFLQRRPEVDPDRIGGIGLSVGGEMMIQTAAETDDLAAIVSDGAGARSTTEDMDGEDRPAVEKWAFDFPPSLVKTATVAVTSNAMPPPNLRGLAGNVQQPMLLIAAPNSPNGEKLNRGYRAAAGDSAELWEIPEAHHMGGITARPQEYERRVIRFFDRALRR
jgi:hypothetical protein